MQSDDEIQIVIAGGGIAGLVLALALRKQLHITPRVYEQAPAFSDGVGGAIGMYPNGLRVIRNTDPDLLMRLREDGYPYIYRRWYRHDGTEVACAREAMLTPSKEDDDELAPIGIRRWKLQRALCDACEKAGIHIVFSKHVESAVTQDDGKVELTFADGDKTTADIVFGADGVKSKIRNAVIGTGNEEPEY
jgi:2-polyprenyl-6-methoxyphenol hydroxylase-like FAD-dependent oxidoreductase